MLGRYAADQRTGVVVGQLECEQWRRRDRVGLWLGADLHQQIDVSAGVVGVFWMITVAVAAVVTKVIAVTPVVAIMTALHVVDLEVRIAVIVRADDPVARHRQRDQQDTTQPQQQLPWRLAGQLVGCGVCHSFATLSMSVRMVRVVKAA